MIARTQLAILHFNSIINAEQAVTKDGVPKFKFQFSKLSKTYVVKKINNVPERKYVNDLMDTALASLSSGHINPLPKTPQFDDPISKPSKEEVIRLQKSRFK